MGLSSRVVLGDGPSPARLVLVGEAPGKDEDRMGRPFVGKSGKLLWAWVKMILGIRREECFVTNLVKQRPTMPSNPDKDRHPTQPEIDLWAPYLVGELLQTHPSVIVALGRFSASFLTGRDISMDESNGLAYPCMIPGLEGAIVVVVVHPAAGLHEEKFVDLTPRGLEGVRDALEGNPKWQPTWTPSCPWGTAIADDGASWELVEAQVGDAEDVGLDTEGDKNSPYCLSFCNSLSPMLGVVVSREKLNADYDFKSKFVLWLSKARRIAIHNLPWDYQVLLPMGIDLAHLESSGVELTDTMVLAHNRANLPKGLKALCRRLFGMPIQDFDEVVSPIIREAQDRWLEVVLRTSAKRAWDLTKKGAWQAKSPIAKGFLAIHKDQLKGKPVDVEARVKAWVKKGLFEHPDTEGGYQNALREMPSEAHWQLHVPLSRMAPYAGLDAIAHLMVLQYFDTDRAHETPEDLSLHASLDDEDCRRITLIDRMHRNGFPINTEKCQALIEVERVKMEEKTKFLQCIAGPEFNPNSPDQVAELLFDNLKLPPPKHKTPTGDRYAVDEEAFDQIVAQSGKHPVVDAVKSIRESTKVISTYLEPLLELARDVTPHETLHGTIGNTQGLSGFRVHHTLSHTNTVSGRLAGLLLTIPQHPKIEGGVIVSDLGKRVCAVLEAQLGHVLYAADLSQIEYRVMADESRDPAAMGAYESGSDLHKVTMAKFSIPRIKAKTVNFRNLYGGTPQGLAEELGISLEEATQFQRGWFEQYPGVMTAIFDTYASTRRLGYSQDRWGRRRYLSATRLMDREWPMMKLRSAAEREAWSLRIQGGATGCMRKAELETHEKVIPQVRRQGFFIEPILQRHDELMLEITDSPECIALVDSLMLPAMIAAQPWFKVPLKAESKWGQSWADLKD